MKFILSVFLLLLLTNENSMAQDSPKEEIYMTVKVAGGVSNSFNSNVDYSGRFSSMFVATIEKNKKKSMAISLGLDNRGYEINGIFEDYKYDFSFLSLVPTFKWSINERISLLTGGYISYLVRVNIRDTTGARVSRFGGSFRRFDFGLYLEQNYQITKRFKLVLAESLHPGISRTYNSNYSLRFGLGYTIL